MEYITLDRKVSDVIYVRNLGDKTLSIDGGRVDGRWSSQTLP